MKTTMPLLVLVTHSAPVSASAGLGMIMSATAATSTQGMVEMKKYANFSRKLSDHCYSVEIPEPELHDWWCSDELIKDACEHYRGGKYSVTLSSSPEFTNMYQDTWGDIQSVYEEDILR